MTIVVYGAGAVGCFYGGLLARAGRDVRFVARGSQLEALATRGIRISSLLLGDVEMCPVRVSARAADFGHADLVLVCVKTHQTEAILDDVAATLHPGSVCIALQNGLEADDALVAKLGAGRVISAVVYVGASIDEPGVVRHVAAGTLVLANPFGVQADRLADVVDALSVPGIRVRVTDHLQRQRWYKLMWNASFNAVSALTLRSSLSLLDMPAARDVIVMVMREVAAIANANGVYLTNADIEKSLSETALLPPIRTSMLADRERGREMETEALLGVVVRMGKAANVPTPTSDVLYALLKAVGDGNTAEWRAVDAGRLPGFDPAP